MQGWKIDAADDSRTLTSAWIETAMTTILVRIYKVALSRVRGLKHPVEQTPFQNLLSHSHECVD